MSIYEYVNISSNERGFKYLKRFEQTWMKSCILFQNSSIRSDLEIRPWRRAVEHYIRSSSLVKGQQFFRSRWKKMLNINKSLRAFSLSPTRQRKYWVWIRVACLSPILSSWSISSGGKQARNRERWDAGATPFSRSWYHSTLSALADSARLIWRKEEKSSFVELETDRIDLSHTRRSSSDDKQVIPGAQIGYLAACRIMESFHLSFSLTFLRFLRFLIVQLKINEK